MRVVIQIEHNGQYSKTAEEVDTDETWAGPDIISTGPSPRDVATRVLERALTNWERKD